MQCNFHRCDCTVYTCNCGNRDDTNWGTYLNKHGTASNQNDRIIDASFFGRFPPKTNITSLFVLFIQSVFVKLKFNLHCFAKGQANIGGGGGILIQLGNNIYEDLYLVSQSLLKMLFNRILQLKQTSKDKIFGF